ncbi:hypothetical protein SAMN05443667_106114 [Flavobacterium gillisiae]|uniref:Uncharacterized protein n=1 Tax=Flavobacterium gillisiae TaxID=150146 RepID=A0A1H4CM94_9FLAO|nr:hypothetical protein [Flavobacterium gillisiae]SEA61575.1 hypothetical protein SAMN05443667_106114 [Flavobacterium gillisiae]
MNKIALLKGFLLGIIGSLFGIFIFISFFTPYSFMSGIQIMKSQGSLGKLITLGSILDLAIFAVLLKLNKDFIARGVILAVIALTVLTLFI